MILSLDSNSNTCTVFEIKTVDLNSNIELKNGIGNKCKKTSGGPVDS